MDKDFLDDFMPSESEAPEPTVEAVAEPERQPDPAPVRDDKGRFAPKGETPQPEVAESVEPTDKPLDKDEFQGLKNERKRRQEAEERLQALEKQLQELQAPKEPPAPPPSLWEDEQGWQQHLQSQVLRQADQLSRINASEMAARAQHADFGEMFDLFNEMAAQNPSVVQQAMADPHPWGAAYKIAKNYKSMQDMGAVDVSDLEAKIEARLREELAVKQPAPTPAIPSSLADAQSSRMAGQGVPTLTLDDIVGPRR